MIKRLGIFTLTIITGFFVFGGDVFGAESCVAGGTLEVRIDNNTSNFNFIGAGLLKNGLFSWHIDGQNGTPNPDLSTSAGKVNVENGGFNVAVALPQGNYKFTIFDPDFKSACEVTFNGGGEDKEDNSVGEGGICFEPADCIAVVTGKLMCDKLDANSSVRVCKDSNGTTDLNAYLGHGSVCDINSKIISGTCDPKRGLSCIKVSLTPDEASMVGYDTEWKCLNASSSNVNATFTSFPQQFLNIPQLINLIIKFSIGVAGVVAFFLLAIGSYKYMLSAGDPKALQSAQETISSAIAGLVLIILAVSIFGIMSGILQIPGIDLAGDNLNIETPNIPDSK